MKRSRDTGMELMLADIRAEVAYTRSMIGRDDLGEQVMLALPGLGDVSEDASFVDRRQEGIDFRIAGQDDPDDMGVFVVDDAEQVQATHLRHTHVGDDDVHGMGFEQRDRLGPAGGEERVEVSVADDSFYGLEYEFFIINKQHCLAIHG